MSNYNQIIKSKPAVLVEFFASWCPHCKRMAPVVEQIKTLVGDSAAVYQFDIDEFPDLAEKNGADTVPTFIVYRDGAEVWRHSGEIDGQDLYSHVEG